MVWKRLIVSWGVVGQRRISLLLEDLTTSTTGGLYTSMHPSSPPISSRLSAIVMDLLSECAGRTVRTSERMNRVQRIHEFTIYGDARRRSTGTFVRNKAHPSEKLPV